MVACRFELSEEDRAIFKDIQQVLDNQGVQSEDTHLATLSVLRQIENRLNMNLGDITQEIRATRGNGAVDLDSMEQSFMSQIFRLFVERSNGVGAGSSSSVGEHIACIHIDHVEYCSCYPSCPSRFESFNSNHV